MVEIVEKLFLAKGAVNMAGLNLCIASFFASLGLGLVGFPLVGFPIGGFAIGLLALVQAFIIFEALIDSSKPEQRALVNARTRVQLILGATVSLSTYAASLILLLGLRAFWTESIVVTVLTLLCFMVLFPIFSCFLWMDFWFRRGCPESGNGKKIEK